MNQQTIQILKVGARVGSRQKHAVITLRDRVILAVKSQDKWITVCSGPNCTEVRSGFLNQLF